VCICVCKKPSGRPRKSMIDYLNAGSYAEMKTQTEDRKKCRSWMPRTWRKAEPMMTLMI
jgi:hypothetical protein